MMFIVINLLQDEKLNLNFQLKHLKGSSTLENAAVMWKNEINK